MVCRMKKAVIALLNKEIFEECKWCGGSGDDGGGYNACPDCESTGLKGGRSAVEAMDRAIEEDYQRHLKGGNKHEDR